MLEGEGEKNHLKRSYQQLMIAIRLNSDFLFPSPFPPLSFPRF